LAARGRQDDLVQLVFRVALEALKNGVMLAISRQQKDAFTLGGFDDVCATENQ
jgi:hypothetical protein